MTTLFVKPQFLTEKGIRAFFPPESTVIYCETPPSGSHGCLAASLTLTSYYNLVCGSRRGKLSVQHQPGGTGQTERTVCYRLLLPPHH